jgi:hypothetical protein
VIALRVSACVAVAITAAVIYFTARRVNRGFVAPIAAVVLYTAWTARLWGLSGNTEIYLNALVAPAMYLLLRAGDGSRGSGRLVAPLSLAGLLLGLALQVKHVALAETALFFAVAVVLALGVDRRCAILTIAAAAVCFLLPSLIVTAYFWIEGVAAQYFHAVINANLIYAMERPGLGQILREVPRSFIIPILAIFGAAIVAWRRRDRRTALVLAWAVAAAIDVALPGKFWAHYFLLIVPPAALLGGSLAQALHEALRLRWRQLSAVAVAALVLLAGNPIGVYRDSMKMRAFGQHDAPAVVADLISEDLSPEDAIFVFNYQPVIYLLTGARLPTRHVLPADWSRRYSAVTGVDPLKELDRVFGARPEYVVFLDTDWIKMGDDVLASLHRHLRNYERRFEVTDEQILPHPATVEIYRRIPSAELREEPIARSAADRP